MENTKTQVAPNGAGARGGPGNRTPAVKIPATEIYDVRSYMFDSIETRESMWLDRVHPWAEDIARLLEKIAIGISTASVTISDEYVVLKVKDRWKVALNRDCTVVIKVPDCALVVDDNFLLLCMDKSGLYVPVAKSETITWDGTEEYFTPDDVCRLVKDALKRVLERARWLWP